MTGLDRYVLYVGVGSFEIVYTAIRISSELKGVCLNMYEIQRSMFLKKYHYQKYQFI